MNAWQERVRAFQAMLGRPTSPQTPAIRRGRACARVLLEEALETAVGLVGEDEAMEVLEEIKDEVLEKLAKLSPDGPVCENVVEVVDGLCDTICVALGIAEHVGVDLEPHFAAVMDANMRKTPGDVDGHGKRGVKPPGWVDPKGAIAGLLLEQGIFSDGPMEGATVDAVAAAMERRS